jgi:predicted enzyme involved in methoxymalonyl-ACP biosynthesis
MKPASEASLSIFDIDHVAALHGRRNWIDERYWFHSRHAFSLDAAGIVAHHGARLIAASRGLSRKCLVLDLMAAITTIISRRSRPVSSDRGARLARRTDYDVYQQ